MLLQTVVLCHPSGPVVEQQEEEFWHCAKRVNNALKTDMVLPGGGYAENACIDILQNMTGTFVCNLVLFLHYLLGLVSMNVVN